MRKKKTNDVKGKSERRQNDKKIEEKRGTRKKTAKILRSYVLSQNLALKAKEKN
jgi:hypothetical protein